MNETETTVPPIPDEVLARVDEIQYEQTPGFPAERGYDWTTCASVETAPGAMS